MRNTQPSGEKSSFVSHPFRVDIHTTNTTDEEYSIVSIHDGDGYMIYAAHHRNFVPYFPYQTFTGGNAVTNKAGVLRRIFDAIFESRQKQADRDIARFLARSGGRLTDDIEREITQRLLTGNWNPRQ
jgi:hypothetical protein